MSVAEIQKIASWPHWTTPESFLDRVRRVGSIALDPCWNPAALTRPRYYCDEQTNGLAPEWKLFTLAGLAFGLAFVNPPYARGHIDRWTAKMAAEASVGVEIIGLLPANMDAGWMHQDILGTAIAALIWRGRIQFENPPPGVKGGGNRYQSLVAYWGPQPDRFAWAFQDAGKLWRLK